MESAERVLVYDRIDANRRSTFLLLALFVLFTAAFFGAVGAFSAVYGGASEEEMLPSSLTIAVVAAGIALMLGLGMYYAAPMTVLTISGVHQVTKEEEPELYRTVENLCIGSGLPMPKVYVLEDSAPNAFATGRDPQHAHVVATRGLLDKLDKRELEGGIAHEFYH